MVVVLRDGTSEVNYMPEYYRPRQMLGLSRISATAELVLS